MKIALLLILCCATRILAGEDKSSDNTPHALKVEGDVEYVHDPSIAKDGDTWYLFGTANGPVRKGELPIRCSQDLQHWKLCGYVFEKIPDWIMKESPATKGTVGARRFLFQWRVSPVLRIFGVRQKHLWDCASHQQDARPKECRFPLDRQGVGSSLPPGRRL